MLLHITHDTLYHYSPQVEVSHHIAHLSPVDTLTQQVLSQCVSILPSLSGLDTHMDSFGNFVHHWCMAVPHQHLQVRSESTVRTTSLPGSALLDTAWDTLGWEQAVARFEYQAGRGSPPEILYSYASLHVPRDADLLAWAQQDFTPKASLRQAAVALMRRLHREFTYDSQSTHVGTPTMQAFAQRRGVCQDFAHILLGALRSLGLAARYVSGYLLTHPPEGQPRLIGADASHAWVSLYLPPLVSGARQGMWYDLDPTNNRSGWHSPGEDYVHLATGRDFADVSPLRGVLQGGSSHTVQVAVTVMPMDQADPPAPAHSPSH